MDNLHPLIEIFILSYNRPEYILQTIDSVIKQDYSNMKIVVSDNSTRDDVETKIRGSDYNSKITYVRRKPTLPALSHFNTVFSEATADYFMIFHDDDVLLPEAVSKMMNVITKDPSLSAVGGNAFIIENTTFTKKVFDSHLNSGFKITDPDQIAMHYLDPSKGHVPFPSYIYRKNKVKGLQMLFKEGQKHSDVSFLIKTCKKGAFYWIDDKVMYYRKHESNDSVNLDIPAIFSLCRFLEKNTLISATIINQFKMKSCLLWLNQRRVGAAKSLSTHRDRVIMKSAIKFVYTHPLLFTKIAIKRLI